jgi:hypothetical protein
MYVLACNELDWLLSDAEFVIYILTDVRATLCSCVAAEWLFALLFLSASPSVLC